MKLADRELIYDEAFKVYIGRRQFRSTDGTLKFSTTWYAEMYHNGKQRRIALGVRTRLHAFKAAQKVAESQAAGELQMADRTRLKVREMIEAYLAWQRLNDRAPKTMEKYDYVLRDEFRPWWERQGNKPAATFNGGHYLAFKKKLAEKGLAESTVADRLMIVRLLFKWAAVRCDPPLLPKYPLANVPLPKVPEKQQYCFTSEQVRTILNNASEAEKPIYAAFAFTGLRFGEVRDLEWTDIELRDHGGTIYVRRGGSRKGMTKSGRGRPVPINEELHAVLSALPRVSERVFSHPPTPMYPADSRKLEQTQFLKSFKRYCKSLGFPEWKKMKLHTFRHFFASVCARNNVSYKYALRWMGHSSSDILDLYFHLYDREAQSAMNGLSFTPNNEGNAA